MAKNNFFRADRTQMPEIGQLEFKGFPDYRTGKLSNGISWFGFHHDDFSVLRIDIVVPCGSWIQKRFFQAIATARMFMEGAEGKSAFEIAENIDFMGSYTDSFSSNHAVTLSAYVLKSKFSQMLQLLRLLITKPTFPEKELKILMMNLKQEYIVGSEKVSTLARRKFPSLIFGTNHPYGKIPQIDDFDKIQRKDVLEYFDMMSFADMKIYLGGNIDDALIGILEKEFGQINFSKVQNEILNFPLESNELFRHHIQKDKAVQSAIIMGKEVINRKNKDYPLLSFAVTVLGGYFGSRLMSKIREEKGLTYGIFSMVQSKPQGTYFSIQSEVIAERTQEAIDEIFYEISRLSNEIMSNEELELVRNYSMGGLMRSFDGPFQLIDRLKLIHTHDLDAKTYYQKVVDAFLAVKPEDISRILKEQVNSEEIYVLTVGSK